MPAEPAADQPVAPTDENLSSKTAEPDPDYAPTENPNATVVPGQMRSDREEIPAPFTKADADKAETMEAREGLSRAAVGCQTFWPSPYEVCGIILDKYNSLGGPGSFLSFPNSPEYTNPDGFGKRTQFLNGPIYWSSATGAHPVVNSFLNRWGMLGYEAGRLHYPTTDEIVLPDGGRRQEFQDGVIYVAFQNAIGSAMFNGPLRDKYNTVAGLTPGSSFLGYPIQDQLAPLPDGQGQAARFLNGVIYWSPATGAHWILGRLLDIWSQAGYETGEYGYPTSDTVPRSGEPGSAEQTFVSGTMFSSSNQQFQGLVVPVSGGPEPTFKSYDTGEHPLYNLDPNLSQYDTVSDPTGSASDGNRQVAAATSAYFADQGATNSRALFEHYYGNDGLGYGANKNYLYKCLRSDEQFYPADDNGVVPTPSGTISFNNQSEAISAATIEAQRVNRKVKVILSGPWYANIAASDQDCVLGLGRFTMSSTTAVIAFPGALGQQQWTARQAGHLEDIYDFMSGSAEYPALTQAAVNNAYRGMELGIAKPFLTYGDSVDYYSQGTR